MAEVCVITKRLYEGVMHRLYGIVLHVDAVCDGVFRMPNDGFDDVIIRPVMGEL